MLRAGELTGVYSPNHMEMIAHQTIRMRLPLGLAARLAQGGKKSLAVLVIPEDILTLIPAVHDVIHGPRILNAQLARHHQTLPARPECQ